MIHSGTPSFLWTSSWPFTQGHQSLGSGKGKGTRTLLYNEDHNFIYPIFAQRRIIMTSTTAKTQVVCPKHHLTEPPFAVLFTWQSCTSCTKGVELTITLSIICLCVGAKRFSGRVLVLRSRDGWFEPRRRHYICVI